MAQDKSVQDGACKVPKTGTLQLCCLLERVSVYVAVVWQEVINISKHTSDCIFRVFECREIRKGNKVEIL